MMSTTRRRTVLVILALACITFILYFQLDSPRSYLTVERQYVTDEEFRVRQLSSTNSKNIKSPSDLNVDASFATLLTDQSRASVISFVPKNLVSAFHHKVDVVKLDIADSIMLNDSNVADPEFSYAKNGLVSVRDNTDKNEKRNIEKADSSYPGGKKKSTRQPSRAGVVADYCNFPEDMNVGGEGKAPSGYRLVSVHAVVRHGARVPMNASLSLGPIDFPKVKCKLSLSLSYMPGILKHFIAETKGSKTSPGWRYPLRPMSQYCQPAELTQIGVEQHIRVGQLLRQAYSTQVNISQRHIRVSSTRKIRTYQSAIALVYGLLDGQVDYKTMEIEKLNNNNLCRSTRKVSCECPRVTSLWNRGQRNVATVTRKLDPHFKSFNTSMFKSLGKKYRDAPSYYPWRTAHSMMTSRLCNRLPLPCNNKYCFRESQADANWESLNFYHQALSDNSDLKLWAKLAMNHFLRELVSDMSRHSTHPNPTHQTISVYTGHDNTIIPLLLALGLPIKQWPPFASRLVFELYKPISKKGIYLFKVISNGENFTKYLKFCGTELEKFGDCSLRLLMDYYLNILADTNYTNYADACRNEK